MIELFEQYGYNRSGFYDDLTDRQLENLTGLKQKNIYIYNRDTSCLCIDFDEEVRKHHFETNYFIGVDWIIENKQAVYVQPKLNKDGVEIDYMGMLQVALQDPENLNHLDGLLYVDFEKSYIKIDQKQDLLSPFLIAQFLQLLKQIVRKGLKKSYYTKTESLKSKVKGKILVSRNIKQNLSRGNATDTYCMYQEFGLNCIENKILKKALLFSSRVLQQKHVGIDTKPLLNVLSYIYPAFENVSADVAIEKIKSFKANPLFKEYDLALKYALLILRKYSYNITKTYEYEVKTPPFWIDMSKLFELYAYKKLRDLFSSTGEVIYHKKAYYQEIDFLINNPKYSVKMVVDTKYKPQYHTRKGIEKEDARQISGYARLESVYKEFGMCDKQDLNIDCLILYSHQGCMSEDLKIEQFTSDKFKVAGYVKIYKAGIKLPEL